MHVTKGKQQVWDDKIVQEFQSNSYKERWNYGVIEAAAAARGREGT